MELLQSHVAIEWFIENKFFVNPDKFLTILLDKQKSDYTVSFEEIQVIFSVDIQGVTIDKN